MNLNSVLTAHLQQSIPVLFLKEHTIGFAHIKAQSKSSVEVSNERFVCNLHNKETGNGSRYHSSTWSQLCLCVLCLLLQLQMLAVDLAGC